MYYQKDKLPEPAFAHRNVPIVFSTSNSYIPYLGPLVQSILDHSHPENNYDIWVLHTDAREPYKSYLKAVVQGHDNFSVRFLDVSERFPGELVVPGREFIGGRYRTGIQEIFSSYEKVIYLDNDMVVRADLKELLDVDLGDNYIAAVRDMGMEWMYASWVAEGKYPFVKECVEGLDNPIDYFCNGMMVINCDKLRAAFSVETLLTRRESKYKMQDLMNYLYQGKVKYLQMTWNFFPPMFKHKEALAPAEIYEDYMNAARDPKIIHFVGMQLPTMAPNVFGAQWFWEAARKTPFYEILLSMMVENLIEMGNPNNDNEELKKAYSRLHPDYSRFYAELEKRSREQ